MSAENIDLIRLMFEAFNSRDLERMVENLHPDFEWRPALSPGGLEGRVYRGPEGLAQWLEEVAETWDSMQASEVEFRSVDADRVLALGRITVTGRASGLTIEQDLAHVWELEDGRIRRNTAYMSHAEARKAAGLT